jgi:hypothetical protein
VQLANIIMRDITMFAIWLVPTIAFEIMIIFCFHFKTLSFGLGLDQCPHPLHRKANWLN